MDSRKEHFPSIRRMNRSSRKTSPDLAAPSFRSFSRHVTKKSFCYNINCKSGEMDESQDSLRYSSQLDFLDLPPFGLYAKNEPRNHIFQIAKVSTKILQK